MADETAQITEDIPEAKEVFKGEEPQPSESPPKSGAWLCHKQAKYVILFVILLLIVIVVLIILVTVDHGVSGESSPTVQVDCFAVKGTQSKDVYVFKGIPYAEPPVGSLRWKPPVPIQEGSSKCEIQTHDATQFGSKCYQRNWVDPTRYEGSEDCLFINVWTPSLDPNANLPVFVWIHGGCLFSLSGATPTYRPNEEITKEGNMVFVSMNYRLSAFGFMALDILSEDSKTNTSGNYGFMDQILALQWVKTNIKKFGGNHDLVTIVGQSSGGTSIHALLVSPQAKGLFHRAWLSSPSAILNATLEQASRDNLVFLNNTGCVDVSCLRGLAPKQILDFIPWDVYPFWAMSDQVDLPTKGRFYGPSAIVDGIVVPKAPKELWENSGQGIDVPVIMGSTAQEIDLWPPFSDLDTWNQSQYENYVHSRLDTFDKSISRRALQLYPYEKGSNPEYLFTSMSSDLRVNCPLDELSKAMATSSKHPVYRYVVTIWPSQSAGYFGIPFKPSFAFHAIEAFAFFGTLAGPLSKAEAEFQDGFRAEIFRFVRTGKVSTANWTGYPSATALINNNVTIVDRYNKEQCDFWDVNGFFSYGWIN